MEIKQLKENDLLCIWREQSYYAEDETLLFELVEASEWVDGGKYQSRDVVFKEVATGKHYSFEIIRSGSYFSDYHYETYDTPTEVEKVTKTITVTKWVAV